MELKTSLTGSYPPLYESSQEFHQLPPRERDIIARESIKRAIEDQIRLGIDILVDGQVRDDIVSMFARELTGYKGDSLPFKIIEPIRPADNPVTLKDYEYARELAGGRPIKAHITGPMTMSRTTDVEDSSGYTDRNDPQLIRDLARALAEEAKALVNAGAEIVQLDEPALADGVDLGLAFEAMEEIVQVGQIPILALHACGNVTRILDDVLTSSPAKIISIEGEWLQRDRLNHIDQNYLDEFDKQIALGAIKVSDYRVERLTRVQDFLDQMALRLGEKNIWAVTPNCGLRLVPYATVQNKLEVMVKAAKSL